MSAEVRRATTDDTRSVDSASVQTPERAARPEQGRGIGRWQAVTAGVAVLALLAAEKMGRVFSPHGAAQANVRVSDAEKARIAQQERNEAVWRQAMKDQALYFWTSAQNADSADHIEKCIAGMDSCLQHASSSREAIGAGDEQLKQCWQRVAGLYWQAAQGAGTTAGLEAQLGNMDHCLAKACCTREAIGAGKEEVKELWKDVSKKVWRVVNGSLEGVETTGLAFYLPHFEATLAKGGLKAEDAGVSAEDLRKSYLVLAKKHLRDAALGGAVDQSVEHMDIALAKAGATRADIGADTVLEELKAKRK